ncbi:Oligopeptide ABC transporter, periplasmic oligopeptide-binding protein OppA [Streptococcus sp. HSISB1]|nr:Oligopeptide ABC transporter, periplasmic oligopeptide-binding protein OppA [Streptococcus sp. HSISB1]
MFVPPKFVSSDGKDFGDYVKDELGDNATWKDVDFSDAKDGLYNVDKAKAAFSKAKSTLQSEGVQFPIHLDFPVDQTSDITTQQANSFKQSVEASLGKDNVVVDIQKESEEDYQRTGYFAESADQKDYDLSQDSGWSPDYDDPSTYLDILNSDTGTSIKNSGIDSSTDEGKEVAQRVGLDQFNKLVTDANNVTDDITARYTDYAKAQAWLTDSAIIIPTTSLGGTPSVSKVVPFSASYSTSGIKGSDCYKYYQLQDKPVTVKQYKKALDGWKKAKDKSNTEYQEKLSEHIEK